MYTLYCNPFPPPPVGQLDTESASHGWYPVMVHTHKRRILQYIETLRATSHMAGFQGWKRYRVFSHPKRNTIIGRCIAEGDF